MQSSARWLPTSGVTKPTDLSHKPACRHLGNYNDDDDDADAVKIRSNRVKKAVLSRENRAMPL